MAINIIILSARFLYGPRRETVCPVNRFLRDSQALIKPWLCNNNWYLSNHVITVPNRSLWRSGIIRHYYMYASIECLPENSECLHLIGYFTIVNNSARCNRKPFYLKYVQVC